MIHFDDSLFLKSPFYFVHPGLNRKMLFRFIQVENFWDLVSFPEKWCSKHCFKGVWYRLFYIFEMVSLLNYQYFFFHQRLNWKLIICRWIKKYTNFQGFALFWQIFCWNGFVNLKNLFVPTVQKHQNMVGSF